MAFSQTIFLQNSSIHLRIFGHGPQAVVCFHGYGEKAESFEWLEAHCGADYRFYSVDLPFHGQTDWKAHTPFEGKDLVLIIEAIYQLHVEHCQLPANKIPLFYLLGYSLGGRICLKVYEEMPHRIAKVVLLAPDGIKVNPWYWLATQTIMGNRLFEYTMHHPGWFFYLLKMFNKFRLINRSIYKFVHHYIDDAAVRRELFQRWVGLRKIKPSLSKIIKEAKQHGTPFRLLYGKYDRIILPNRGEKFCQALPGQCQLKVLNAGHQLLQPKMTEEIAGALKG